MSLGEQNQMVPLSQIGERRFDAVNQLHRLFENPLGEAFYDFEFPLGEGLLGKNAETLLQVRPKFAEP